MWLIDVHKDFPRDKLPSEEHVLALFGYYHFDKKKVIHESATLTSEEVIKSWKRVLIPVRQKHRVVKKVKDLFDIWRNLKKNKENKLKQSLKNQQNQANFKIKIKNLFDIAHRNALEMIKNEKLKQFLLAQREEGRQGRIQSIKAVIKAMSNTIDNKQSTLPSESSQTSCSSLDSPLDNIAADPYVASPNVSQPPKTKKVILMNDELVPTLDRIGVSDRQAAHLLPAIAHSLGQNVSTAVCSASTIRRVRRSERIKLSAEIKEKLNLSSPLTIHWDGKRLDSISNKGNKDERQHHTASISAMSFDTTASNTGPKSGACVLLQDKLQKDLLYMACRHHIFEIVLQAVFDTSLGPSSAPETMIFNRFKKEWNSLDKTKFRNGLTEESVSSVVLSKKADIIAFVQNKLQHQQPRDDYRELLELCLTFLGVNEKPNFKQPGSTSRARWMAKAIYVLKMYMLQDVFHLTARVKKSLEKICIFVITVYIFAWYEAPNAICAPKNDLDFLQELHKFRNVDKSLAEVAIQKFTRHLWYLSEETIPLTLFDNRVSEETKKKIVQAFQTNKELTNGIAKRTSDRDIKATLSTNVNISELSLDYFATSKSIRFFEILQFEDIGFLDKEIAQWDDDDGYVKCKFVCEHLKVVNDVSERGVRLMAQYNDLLPKDEMQKQALLIEVAENRKKVPDMRKKTILKSIVKHN